MYGACKLGSLRTSRVSYTQTTSPPWRSLASGAWGKVTGGTASCSRWFFPCQEPPSLLLLSGSCLGEEASAKLRGIPSMKVHSPGTPSVMGNSLPPGATMVGMACLPASTAALDSSPVGSSSSQGTVLGGQAGLWGQESLEYSISQGERPGLRPLLNSDMSDNLIRGCNGALPTPHSGLHSTVKSKLAADLGEEGVQNPIPTVFSQYHAFSFLTNSPLRVLALTEQPTSLHLTLWLLKVGMAGLEPCVAVCLSEREGGRTE